MLKAKCRLCESETELQLSHIIPAFVVRWHKATSFGGVRSSDNPNKRVQDGPKEYLLCKDCENDRLSKWEKPFAEQVFEPLHEESFDGRRVLYSDWALKFAVSASWRAMHAIASKGLDALSQQDLAAFKSAEVAARAFLLGNSPHPGQFEQHLVHLQAPVATTRAVHPYLSRYFLRTFEIDLYASPAASFVYVKLCQIAIFGFLRVSEKRDWQGTKLHVREGSIGGRDIKLPFGIAEYWNQRADLVCTLSNATSVAQTDKLRNIMDNANKDDLAASRSFKAMSSDVNLSGLPAFRKPVDPKPAG